MNAPAGALRAPMTIDLSTEAPFSLGGLAVRPATRETEAGGRRELLEPKVMQVLVALAQARGAVVSRDGLIDRCWGGRIVGDDALNRCVQRLRRLGREAGGAFSIETIAKVGYRLEVAEARTPRGVAPGRRARRILGAALGLAAILAVAVAAWASLRDRPWTATDMRPLVATPEYEGYPAVSPDGTQVAYSALVERDGWRIHIRGADGGEAITIPGAAGVDDLWPAWSPAGDQLIYSTMTFSGQGPCRILLIRPPKDTPREIARCQGAPAVRPVWTPDGRAILFADAPDADAPRRLVRLDLATGARREITRPIPGWDDATGLPSPDGRRLAIGRRQNFDIGALAVRDERTGRERIVARDMTGFAWSKDSRTLFVARNVAASGHGLWTYRADGRGGRLMLPTSDTISRLTVGKGWLAFESRGFQENLVQPPPVAGGAPTPLDPAKGVTWGFQFRRDGLLALTSNRSGKSEVWLKAPGRPARQLTAIRAQAAYAPRWSPDGTRIVVAVMQANRFHICVFGADGALLDRIAAPTQDIDDPDWSPDGRALLVAARDAAGWRIWRHDLGGPKRFRPTAQTDWRYPRQADGLLYAERPGTLAIWRISGAPKEIVPPGRRADVTAWTVRDGRVIYLDRRDEAHRKLMAAPVGGGAATVLAEAPQAQAFSDLDIDPLTGRPVYVAVIGQAVDINRVTLARR